MGFGVLAVERTGLVENPFVGREGFEVKSDKDGQVVVALSKLEKVFYTCDRDGPNMVGEDSADARGAIAVGDALTAESFLEIFSFWSPYNKGKGIPHL